MPRENRKRGKKHKKQIQEQESRPSPPKKIVEEPSWILPSSKSVDTRDPDAPFGELEADVKAYFRTVDIEIRDWQEDRTAEENNVQRDESACIATVSS